MRRASAILSPAAAAIEFVPPNDSDPISLHDLFSTPAPLHVDLGCGDGSFLAALAEQHPERNFIGVELLLGRVRTSCRRISRLGVTNARIIRLDIARAVAFLLPPRSVDLFYLMFPDPWPKRRHHRRRVVTAEFLACIATALKPRGALRFASDQRDYFDHVVEVAAATGVFDAAMDDDPQLPRSTFELRYVEAGEAIYRLELRKISDPK